MPRLHMVCGWLDKDENVRDYRYEDELMIIQGLEWHPVGTRTNMT